MEQYLAEMGYECTDYTFSDSNDLAAVVTKAAENSDLIYIPTDNTVGANSGIVKNICLEKKGSCIYRKRDHMPGMRRGNLMPGRI